MKGDVLEQTSLNWERIEEILRESFRKEEAQLLRYYYGISMEEPLSEKELAKAVGKRGKKLAEALDKAKGRLFRLLKEEEIEEILLFESKTPQDEMKGETESAETL